MVVLVGVDVLKVSFGIRQRKLTCACLVMAVEGVWLWYAGLLDCWVVVWLVHRVPLTSQSGRTRPDDARGTGVRLMISLTERA